MSFHDLFERHVPKTWRQCIRLTENSCARLDQKPPRLLAEGHSAAVSPKGNLVAYISKRNIWSLKLDGNDKPAALVEAKGQSDSLRWSPDGSKLVFVNDRRDLYPEILSRAGLRLEERRRRHVNRRTGRRAGEYYEDVLVAYAD